MHQAAQQFCLKGNNDFALYTDFFLLPYPYPTVQQFCLKGNYDFTLYTDFVSANALSNTTILFGRK
jgi:hypothetical protein